MLTQIKLHEVTAISLGPINHYPATEEYPHAFWTREIVFTDAEGNTHAVQAFADEPGHLALTSTPPLLHAVATPTPLAQAA